MNLPWEDSPDCVWYSVAEYAKRYRRPARTIRQWCVSGILIQRGCRVYRDFSDRWWIGEVALHPAAPAGPPESLRPA